MFNIVLVHPEIPPNTGNVIRLAANTGCALHLIEPLGFSLEDRALRRAGLDYHEYTRVQVHASFGAWLASTAADPQRCFAFSRHAQRSFQSVPWQAGDWLLFGSESAGLPVQVRDHLGTQQLLRLPMRSDQRSLNLSNAVAVAVFEAWRHTGYAGGS